MDPPADLRDVIVSAQRLLQAGQVDAGVRALEAEVVKAPGRIDLWMAFGRLLLNAGRMRESTVQFAEAARMEKDPAAAAEILSQLAAAQRSSGR